LRIVAHYCIITKLHWHEDYVVLSFTPGVKIEKQLKHLQGCLVEIYKELDSVTQEEKNYLNRCALISNVGATTRIENAVLTDVEIEWVDTELSKDGKTTAFEEKKEYILNKLSKDRQRSIEEVVGSRSMLTTVYLQAKEMQPLTEMAIRGLHHELLRYHPPAAHYAGRYKTAFNRVVSRNNQTGEERTVLEHTMPGVMTDVAMRELVDWYNETITGHLWPLLVAVEFTFRFLAIHPFQDGNGRMGRALFLLILLQSGDKFLENVAPYIALDRKIEQNKAQYYTVLHQCSDGKYQTDPSKYKFDALVFYFLKVFEVALDDINVYRGKFRNLNQLSESAVVVLNCFKSSPEKQLKVAEIEKVTKLPRRTIQFTLKTLTGQKFLQKLGQAAGSRYQLVF
jgi:Fic family protein